METLILTATSVLSFGTLPLQTRMRAFYVLFLHFLLMLTVGSLAYRTLGGNGTLLVPIVNKWPGSPFLYLTNTRAYVMLAVSLLTTSAVCFDKARIILAGSSTPVSSQPFVDTAYCCLMMLWIHLAAIFSLILF